MAAFVATACISLGCTQTKPEEQEPVSQKITASIVDNGSSSKWAKTDVIGVYTDASENNIKYTTSSAGTTVTFTASTEVKGAPMYAYYPYSSDNSSRKATGLKGSLAKDSTTSVPHMKKGITIVTFT